VKKLIYISLSLVIIYFVFNSFTQDNRPKKGDDAPELVYNDPDGKPIALSSLNKKIVLLDFWASWCGPCRRANPELVKLYKKYKNAKFRDAKGFEIYSVSLDNSKERWVQAIIKDQLEWSGHVSDLKKWNSEAAKTYGVGKIPTSFLINEEGVIIGVDLHPKAIDLELTRRLKK